MSKQKKILAFFDNSYGGDVPVHGGKAFVHLSYEEVKSLLNSMRLRSFYRLEKKGLEWTFKKTKRGVKKENLLSMKDLLALLECAQKPKHAVDKKSLDEVRSKTGLTKKTGKEPSKKPGFKSKKEPRFDWNDHYLEGLRIHGNKDDAEAHADAMKRKILDRI